MTMLTRRSLLASAAPLMAAPLLAKKEKRPNVLFVSVDDLNDWVGCLQGYPGVSTPNIDRLARRGVLFSNAHCASPLCNPSRVALLTGQRPATTGIYDNDQFWRPSLPNAVSLPEYFRKHGYHASGAGKVFHHTAGNNPPATWDDFQLQVFDDPWYRRADWYPWNQRVPAPEGHPYNGLANFQGEFDWGILPKDESAYGDQRAVDYGIKHLGQTHAKPWFLAIGLWHPHIPMFSPRRFFDLYPKDKLKMPDASASDLDDIPAAGKDLAAFRRVEFERIVKEGKWESCVQAYLAAVSFADAMVGRLLDALEKSAHAANTITVFWSDNGWHLGEKQHFHKSTLWQRATHVPLIFSGPGLRQTGVPRPQPASLLDIYPTLVDLCGLPVKPDLDGLSLKPQLQRAKTPRPPAVITYMPGNHAVRDERWRYIRYKDGGEELYDCLRDPLEHKNLASNPAYAKEIQRLAPFLPKSSAPPKPHRDEYDFDYATHSYRYRGKK
jgi:arylsulfatase A-like enzyme